MQHEPNVTLPRTAADALKLWDAGEPVPAFRVESEGAAQPDIWSAVFSLMRDGKADTTLLTPREVTVVAQISRASHPPPVGHGYAKMVMINLAGGGEPIFVQKPAAPAAT